MQTDSAELIRLYGDLLRSLTPAEYADLVREAVGDGPAARSAISQAAFVERRLVNTVAYKVLRYWHAAQTGEGAEMETDDLQLGW